MSLKLDSFSPYLRLLPRFGSLVKDCYVFPHLPVCHSWMCFCIIGNSCYFLMLGTIACLPVLFIICMSLQVWHQSHLLRTMLVIIASFPRLVLVTCFPVLGTIASLPRSASVACYLGFSTGFTFSCAWHYCMFSSLSISCMLLWVLHRLHVFLCLASLHVSLVWNQLHVTSDLALDVCRLCLQSVARFFRFGNSCMFSSAWHQPQVLPHLRYTFSMFAARSFVNISTLHDAWFQVQHES